MLYAGGGRHARKKLATAMVVWYSAGVMDMDRIFASFNQGLTTASTAIVNFFERVFDFGQVVPNIAATLASAPNDRLVQLGVFGGGVVVLVVALAGVVMFLRHRYGYGFYEGLFGWHSHDYASKTARFIESQSESQTGDKTDHASEGEKANEGEHESLAPRLHAIEQQMASLKKDFDAGRISHDKYVSESRDLYHSAQALYGKSN